MGESVRILVEEASKTADARRFARSMAAKMGLNETVGEQVSIVVTEACTNLLKHAGRGEIILHSSSEGLETTPWLDVLALDQGPGMRNLQQSLRDGYSTGSTPGHGLGAIVRLSQDSDFYTVPQKGTGILARWWTEPPKPSAPGHGIRLANQRRESAQAWRGGFGRRLGSRPLRRLCSRPVSRRPGSRVGGECRCGGGRPHSSSPSRPSAWASPAACP